MSKYTLQAELDTLGLGERWACTFCGPINAGEHAAGRKATDSELDMIIGRAFRYRMAAMANYIDHTDLGKMAADVDNWNTEHPEWAYLVEKRLSLLTAVSEAMDVAIDPRKYQVGIMLTQYGTKHYVVITAAGEMINPDPSLVGEIIETRRLIY